MQTARLIHLVLASGFVGFSLAKVIESYRKVREYDPVNHGLGGPLPNRKSGSEIESEKTHIPKRPSRPTFDQPKPRI